MFDLHGRTSSSGHRHQRGRDVARSGRCRCPSAGPSRCGQCSAGIELLVPTRLTAVDACARVDRPRRSPATLDPSAAALAVADWVRETVAYVPGATGVRTSAQEAYATRRASARTSPTSASGCCATVGMPARYVSGYLHPVAPTRRSA